MQGLKEDPVPTRSYADGGAVRPRFGIRSEACAVASYPAHKHDYFEILLFTSSASSQRIALRDFDTRKGSIFFISPMVAHQTRFDAGASFFIIYFDLAFLRPDLADDAPEIDAQLVRRAPELAPFVYQQHLDFHLSREALATIQALCMRMLIEHAERKLCSEEVIRANLVLLLAEITQRYEDPIRSLMTARPREDGTARHVKGVMRFIRDNVARKVSLEDAARAVALSPNYLAGLLKRETGKTFLEHLTARRVERAGELLAFTNQRVSEVAFQVGFADVDYFTRRFKQVTRLSPTQFRTAKSLLPGAPSQYTRLPQPRGGPQ